VSPARRAQRRRWIAPLLTAALLGAWEVAARAGWIPTLFYPAPTTILGSLVDVIATGELTGHLTATLVRMAIAFAWGGGLGLVLGLAMGWWPGLREVLDPFISALHPVPRMALLPVILLLFGIGFFAKTLAVAIATFFPMVINTMAGVRQLDPNYYDVATLYRASQWRVFSRVVVPGSMPSILTGARLGLVRALGATIGLELITAQSGLGSMLFFAWQTYRTEALFATVFVIALLGYAFRVVLDRLARQLAPWQQEARGG
jgi:NitT/TauT family transport system permease protein